MSLGNPRGSLSDSIWHSNLCFSWIGAWKFLLHFKWVPSLLFSLLGTWHTNWHAYGNFNCKLSGQVSLGISKIAFVLLFDSPLEALFDSDSWSNFLQLILDIRLQSKIRYPDLVGSTSQAKVVVPPSVYGLRFSSLPSRTCPDSPSQTKLAVTYSVLSPVSCTSWYFEEKYFLNLKFASSAQGSITIIVNTSPPEEDQQFEPSAFTRWATRSEERRGPSGI